MLSVLANLHTAADELSRPCFFLIPTFCCAVDHFNRAPGTLVPLIYDLSGRKKYDDAASICWSACFTALLVVSDCALNLLCSIRAVLQGTSRQGQAEPRFALPAGQGAAV